MTRDPPLLQAQQVRDNFSVHMGKWRTAIASSMRWAIFSRNCGQRTMTIKGAKRNAPHLLQAQQNFWHWSVSDIDHRKIGACCACSKRGTFLFAPLMVIVLMKPKGESA